MNEKRYIFVKDFNGDKTYMIPLKDLKRFNELQTKMAEEDVEFGGEEIYEQFDREFGVCLIEDEVISFTDPKIENIEPLNLY